jgi:hypothetical protein
MNGNTSIIDSSKHGMSKSEFVDDQSMATGANYEYKVSITKIKNAFNILMQETPFLVDDKARVECQNKSVKDQFSISIDSIRKSLGIDNMDDVELLVMTFYEYSERRKKELQMQNEEMEEHHSNSNNNQN